MSEDVIFVITASASASDGTITPAGAVEVVSGEDQTFTAAPAAGYEVNQWLVDGEVVHVGGSSHTLIDVIANHTISVTFSIIATRHLCTLTDVKTRLGIEDKPDFDTIINSIITGIDGMFDNYCGRPLLMNSEDVTEEYSSEDCREYLLFNRYPIISITSIKEASDYDFENATALVLNTDYRPSNKGLNGIIYRISDYWLAGDGVIESKYRGGYCGAGETPSQGEYALPAELREAAITQAIFLFKRKDDIGLSSVSSQGGSISKFADVELLPLVKQILDNSKYKKPSM